MWKILRIQVMRMQKNFVKTLKKKLGEHHDFYVPSNSLLLADVFENFKCMCLKIYELDPA